MSRTTSLTPRGVEAGESVPQPGDASGNNTIDQTEAQEFTHKPKSGPNGPPLASEDKREPANDEDPPSFKRRAGSPV